MPAPVTRRRCLATRSLRGNPASDRAPLPQRRGAGCAALRSRLSPVSTRRLSLPFQTGPFVLGRKRRGKKKKIRKNRSHFPELLSRCPLPPGCRGEALRPQPAPQPRSRRCPAPAPPAGRAQLSPLPSSVASEPCGHPPAAAAARGCSRQVAACPSSRTAAELPPLPVLPYPSGARPAASRFPPALPGAPVRCRPAAGPCPALSPSPFQLSRYRRRVPVTLLPRHRHSPRGRPCRDRGRAGAARAPRARPPPGSPRTPRSQRLG